ncbi:MAG: hypothetical protein J3R72DRAFT_236215 [Linnemannia gamsii]|nr:MAG: hypothetical protein J3R72DRAFT_236215 [Linnemannia gamsii]
MNIPFFSSFSFLSSLLLLFFFPSSFSSSSLQLCFPSAPLRLIPLVHFHPFSFSHSHSIHSTHSIRLIQFDSFIHISFNSSCIHISTLIRPARAVKHISFVYSLLTCIILLYHHCFHSHFFSRFIHTCNSRPLFTPPCHSRLAHPLSLFFTRAYPFCCLYPPFLLSLFALPCESLALCHKNNKTTR